MCVSYSSSYLHYDDSLPLSMQAWRWSLLTFTFFLSFMSSLSANIVYFAKNINNNLTFSTHFPLWFYPLIVYICIIILLNNTPKLLLYLLAHRIVPITSYAFSYPLSTLQSSFCERLIWSNLGNFVFNFHWFFFLITWTSTGSHRPNYITLYINTQINWGTNIHF